MTLLVGNQARTSGATSPAPNNTLCGYDIIADASGEAIEMGIAWTSNRQDGTTYRMGIYDDAGILIAETDAFAKVYTGAEDKIVPLLNSASITSGQTYRLAIYVGNAGEMHANSASNAERQAYTDISSGASSPLPSDISAESTASSSRDLPVLYAASASTPTLRKSSTFDIETTLSGTVTDATLDGNAITVDSQDGTTVTLTDSDGSITTSGEYDLVLTDDSADPDETITVQVNVYGITPSNNPVQKDGSAQADLTDVEIRVTDGSALDGTQLYYTATATTDASGNLSPIDLSDTSAADGDPVVLTMRTAAGDGLPSDETVGLI